MKRIFQILSLSIFLSLFSCQKPEKKSIETESKREEKLATKIERRKFENTYPFSSSEYIEVISYPNRNEWNNDLEIIKNGKIKFDQHKIIEKVKLDKLQCKELFEILYNYPCDETYNSACYEPRHAFIFYGKDNKAFAAIEMCFACSNSHETEGIDDLQYCEKEIESLKKFVKGVGVNPVVKE